MGLVSRKRLFLIFAAFLALVVPAACKAAYTKERESKLRCNGSIGECYIEEEFLMDSETSRRMLQDGSHLTNGALEGDQPAGGVQAQQHQPYMRGCQKTNGCRTQVYNE